MATGAAFLALLGGVQVAQAGIADGVGDPIGAVENALPNPPETDLDAVVEEATDAVDELTGSVDADVAVSETKGAVDAAVADPTGTAQNAVEQAKTKVGNPMGTVKDIAEKTPAGKVVNSDTKNVDPVVSGVASPTGQAGAPGASERRDPSRSALPRPSLSKLPRVLRASLQRHREPLSSSAGRARSRRLLRR